MNIKLLYRRLSMLVLAAVVLVAAVMSLRGSPPATALFLLAGICGLGLVLAKASRTSLSDSLYFVWTAPRRIELHVPTRVFFTPRKQWRDAARAIHLGVTELERQATALGRPVELRIASALCNPKRMRRHGFSGRASSFTTGHIARWVVAALLFSSRRLGSQDLSRLKTTWVRQIGATDRPG